MSDSALTALLGNFLTLMEDNDSTDVSLVCYDGEVRAHSIILGARSPVFAKMMKYDITEKKTGKVNIEEFRVITVQAMVTFIYTAKIQDKIVDFELEQLLEIGDKYNIPSLVEACSHKIIVEMIDYELLDLGSLAERCNAPVLMEECANRVDENLKLLEGDEWKEVLKTSPEFFCSIVERIKLKKRLSVISRFSKTLPCASEWDGTQTDAIRFQTNMDIDLVKIGLFCGRQKIVFSVKIKIKELMNGKTGYTKISFDKTIFSSASNKTSVKIKLPSPLRILSSKVYLLEVILDFRSPNKKINTDYGAGGISKVTAGDGSGLVVTFSDSDQDCLMTGVKEGQIPELVFQV